jgi:hypothetical protein
LRTALCFITLFSKWRINLLGCLRIGVKIDSVDEAWDFWVAYGGIAAFDPKKHYNNERKIDGVPTSRRYVCSKAAFREKDSRDHLTKHPRAETRTCYKV